ncbi:MAG: MMPL family transporter, partial [Verrucomicrobiota bacterium]
MPPSLPVPTVSLSWRIGILTLFIAGIVTWGISKISLDVDILSLLPENLPEVQGLEVFLRHFSRPDQMVLVLSHEDPSLLREAEADLMASFREAPLLVEEVFSDPSPKGNPQAFAELVAYALINQPPEDLDRLLGQRLAPGQSSLVLENLLEEIAFGLSPEAAVEKGYDPFGLVQGAFGPDRQLRGSTDGGPALLSQFPPDLRLLYLRSPMPLALTENREMRSWTEALRSHLAAWKNQHPRYSSVSAGLTGEPAIISEISQSMMRDLARSFVLTLLLVAIIFWVWYRSWFPLITLTGLLVLVFLLTLGLSGHLIPRLSVMNVGFASILIGLSVDYGVLIYQRSLRHPRNASLVRRETRRGILGAGVTTAAAFLALKASSLPSLSELGLIVAIGIALGATIMWTLYAGIMARPSASQGPQTSRSAPPFLRPPWTGRISCGVGALIGGAAIILLFDGLPRFDSSDGATRPRHSKAYDALDRITSTMGGSDSAGNVVITAPSEMALLSRLETAAGLLETQRQAGSLVSYDLPLALLPIGPQRLPDFQPLLSR